MTTIEVHCGTADGGPAFEGTGERFDALTALVVHLSQRYGCRATVQIDDGWSVRTDARSAVLYVVMEAVTNACRHGAARSVSIVLDGSSQTVSVTDDGQGFNPMIRRPGRGVARMRASAASAGAVLMMRTMRNGGTKVELRFGHERG